MVQLKKLMPLFLLCSFNATAVTYEVQSGDNLSNILWKLDSVERLYGKKGRLVRVLKLNSDIKNPDRIYVGQIIVLEYGENGKMLKTPDITPIVTPETTPEITSKKEPTNDPVVSEEIQPTVLVESFYLGFSIGPRSFYQKQTAASNIVKDESISWKNMNLFAGYRRNEWEFFLQANTYQARYSSALGSEDKQLFSINPKIYYGNIFVSTLFEQRPFYLLANNSVSMEKIALVLPGVGYRYIKKFNTEVETRMELEGELNYLLTTKADHSSVKTNSESGYGARLSGNLMREFELNLNDKSVYYFWANDLRVRKVKQNLEWNQIKEETKSTFAEFSSQLGIRVEF